MAEDAAPEVTEEAPQEQPAEPVLPAVVVVKNTDESGNITVSVVPHGGVLATEVQTLLELALPSWREKIGLPVK